MNGTLQIAVDLEAGEVQLGSERVRLLPARGDAFYLNNRRGPMVRALRFEERSLLLATNTANVSNGDVASLIADAACVSSGECADEVRVAVSLALAGGAEEAPSFSECARLVEQHAGWNPERVSGTMALVIDRLCGALDQRESNGWERIVFQEDEPDLETLISQMAANLSQRSVGSAPVAKAETEQITTRVEKAKAEEITTAKQTSRAQNVPAQTPKHLSDWPVTSPRSVSSVSSVLPVDRVKRIPARVLALKTRRTTDHNDPIIPVSRNFESTIEATSPARTNHESVVLTQTAPAVFEPPLFTSPSMASWQPFKPLAPNTKTSGVQTPDQTATRSGAQTPEQTTTRFSPAPEAPSFNDWLSELAMLLETECDMRGIDP